MRLCLPIILEVKVVPDRGVPTMNMGEFVKLLSARNFSYLPESIFEWHNEKRQYIF